MKVPLSEWNELLKEFLKSNTIKSYYRKHKGSEDALAQIAYKHISHSYRADLFASDYWNKDYVNAFDTVIKKAFMRGFAVGKSEIDCDIENKVDESEMYFVKNASLYIHEGNSQDFIVLIQTLRKYKEDIERNTKYRAVLKGKTLYEQNESAKKILKDAQYLLYLMGSDIKLPQFEEPNDNKELTKKAKEDILNLDIFFDSTNTIDKLLEDIRKL